MRYTLRRSTENPTYEEFSWFFNLYISTNMKKTIITLMALTCWVEAASLNYSDAAFKNNTELTTGLLGSYNFDTDGNNLVTTSDFAINSWVKDVGQTPSAFPLVEGGYGNLSSTGMYSTQLGQFFNEAGNFTLHFDLIQTAKSSAWGSIVSLYSNGANGTKEWDNALSLRREDGDGYIYLSLTDGGNGVKGFDGRTSNTSKINTGIKADGSSGPCSITIVSAAASEGQTYGTLTLYINGEQKGQVTDWNATKLTGISFGRTFNDNKNPAGTTYIDNLSFWNAALSSSAVSALHVPEPTTATLSLLALAGLAARRRRK